MEMVDKRRSRSSAALIPQGRNFTPHRASLPKCINLNGYTGIVREPTSRGEGVILLVSLRYRNQTKLWPCGC